MFVLAVLWDTIVQVVLKQHEVQANGELLEVQLQLIVLPAIIVLMQQLLI